MTQTTEKPRKKVRLYTDGACSGNPGPGGWAAILSFNGNTRELSGHMPNTTNNRMEVFAVISGIGALKEPCVVEVYSDSAYTVNAFNEHWIDNWQKNGWLNSEKKPVENSDLWKLLLQIIRIKKHEVSFYKVKGHAEDPMNIRCDELARAAIREYRRMNGEPAGDNSVPAAEPGTPATVTEAAKPAQSICNRLPARMGGGTVEHRETQTQLSERARQRQARFSCRELNVRVQNFAVRQQT